jgi:endonuclease/exonuclease/phosphatase family metal-dependent hydrolase
LKPHRKHIILAAAVALLATALAGFRPAPAGAANRATTRVLAYNVAFLPKNFTGIGSRPETFDAIDPIARVDAISNRILDGDYDVVALDEVWTTEAKDEFIKKLGNAYPFHATQLWGNNYVKQDSGLMLFSRFKPIDNPHVPPVTKTIGFGTVGYDYNRLFDPLGNPNASPPTGRDFGFYSCVDKASLAATGPSGGGGPTGQNYIHMGDVSPDFKGCSLAFHLYAKLVSDDSWSEKGVGYVRLQNTRTNRPLNVFFTHNQAMYWDDSPKPFHQHSAEVEEELASNNQAFSEEAAFMNLFVPKNKTANEDTIAIGDHNVPGDTKYYDNAVKNPMFAGMVIAGARDTFRVDQSPSGEDPGLTWDVRNSAVPALDAEGNDRLDYVFDRAGQDAPDCALHLRNMSDWKVKASDIPPTGDPAAEGLDLSDHYPLEVTLGALADRCSPAKALVDPLPPNQPDVNIPGQIGYGGAYQWYRFNGSDTLKISISSPTAMQINAYAATDLTNPLEPSMGSPGLPANGGRDATVTYSNPGTRSAIYLRVRAFDETWADSYSLHVHRASGSNMADAIDLPNDKNGESALGTFEQGLQPGAEQFQLWFHFKTQELWSGKPQWMKFQVTQLKSADPANAASAPDTPDGYAMYIVDANNNIVSSFPNWVDQYTANWDGNLVPAAAGDYYLVVYRRHGPVKRPTAWIKASWQTNLRTIDIKSLWNNQVALDLEAGLWVDQEPPYFFDVGVIVWHQTKALPAPGPYSNPAPIDTHHINIADGVEVSLKSKGAPSAVYQVITANGPLGKASIDTANDKWLYLNYERS